MDRAKYKKRKNKPPVCQSPAGHFVGMMPCTLGLNPVNTVQ